jgi:MerR family mercuric resistance operon transcriptional regulator
MADTQEPVQIGALSERTGVNIETIRYYERIGLLKAPLRSPGGYRRYSMDDVRRLSFIRRLRELGFTLDNVRALLDLAESRRTACGAVRDLAANHLEEVRGKIKDLRRMESVLREMVASCERGARPQCPMIDALWSAST